MNDRYRRCRKCHYFAGSTETCDYIFEEGHSRPCPPGDACTVMKPKTRKRKKALTVS